MKIYYLSELFYSIQGEGFHTGLPAIFIRFSGCNLQCEFCDEPKHKTIHLPYNFNDIQSEINKYPCKTLILTGGEPCLQIDDSLIHQFHTWGYKIHLETNGTMPIPPAIDWVTVSPKTQTFYKGNELKLVYQGQDLSKIDTCGFEYLFIQPLSNSNIDECVDYVKKNPNWRLSVQLHKLIHIP